MSNAVLVVEGLTAGYGPMPVVDDVSFEVGAGELVCLVGRNGAGKSTTMAAIAGRRHSRPRGRVLLAGNDISSTTPSATFRRGLAFVPEGHRVFPDLTVEENLLLGGRFRRTTSSPAEQLDVVYELFPVLRTFSGRHAGRLSGGQQQMVAIGQAIMSAPRVLLLDEPSSGLAPVVVETIFAAIIAMRAAGTALLVVEQSVERALALADYVLVMDGGHIVKRGPASALSEGSAVADIIRGTASGELK